jgi:hypothetical protein
MNAKTVKMQMLRDMVKKMRSRMLNRDLEKHGLKKEKGGSAAPEAAGRPGAKSPFDLLIERGRQ